MKREYGALSVDIGSFVDVDVIWGDLTIQQALGVGRSLDYIVASHVIEHVPDLVTWLAELQAVLRPDGSTRLAIPDRRFCFGYLRQESGLTDILTAYYSRARQPQLREIIDCQLYHLQTTSVAEWGRRDDPFVFRKSEDLHRAFLAADRASNGRYVDSHCWTFTLASFLRLMQQLGSLGLTNLACANYYDTEPDEPEFFVTMVVSDPAHVMESWGRAYADSIGPNSDARETWPEARLKWLDAGQEGLTAEVAGLRSQLAALRNSTSWKITAPMRQLARLVRGQG